jgi:tetratricopeptide (TPR) repeat protein
MNTAKFLLCAVLLGVAVVTVGAGDAYAAKEPKEKNEFPNSKRKEPKAEVSESGQKKLKAGYDAIDANQPDKAEAALNEVLNAQKSSGYEKAAALVGLANIAWEREQTDQAIAYNQKAIDLNALDNRAHFNAIYQNAQLNLQEEHYDASLKSVEQWLAETGSEKADAYALKGNALYRMEKFADAAEAMKKAISLSDKPSDSWYQLLLASYTDAGMDDEAARVGEELLAKDPNNKSIVLQLAAIYMQKDTKDDAAAQAQQDQKALAVLEGAYQRGLLTEEKELKQLYQSYNYLKQPAKAAEVINAGLAKGTLKQNPETLKGLADAYQLSAQELPDNDPKRNELTAKAADAYGQAAAVTTDNGEMDLMRGHLMVELEKWSEAKSSLTTALKKGGLKREGECYVLLGNAEAELGNDQAAIAAYEKARSFPNTKTMAEAWLKNMRQGSRKK